MATIIKNCATSAFSSTPFYSKEMNCLLCVDQLNLLKIRELTINSKNMCMLF